METTKEQAEEFLLQIYRDCWNDLNIDELAEYLDDNVVYSSQWVLESIHGKESFLEYFGSKLNSIRQSSSNLSLTAEIKVCDNHSGELKKPYLEICQISNASIVQVGLFIQVLDGKIVKIDLVEV